SHEDALKVHGISNEFLRDKPKFAQVADELLEYLAGAEIIIHNAAFDVGFLNKELELIGQPAFKTVVGSVTDTLVMAKEMFPGKRNSLDALCDRLGVDNSGRTLHGALLDAELLADVYINLTRGQEALLIDLGSAAGQAVQVHRADLSALQLPVLVASEAEQAAHAAILGQLDKASGGKTVWRSVTAST
ncbi:MAG TPA: DNA polymerase III subunit epsilon, partial [Burkholderiaceae bacterium]